MVDHKEIITTPVHIEFNLENEVKEFNIIDRITALFSIMATIDPGMRILNCAKDTVLWEKGGSIPVQEHFEESLQMKELSYRKGYKKVLVYCIRDTGNNLPVRRD